ncbi:hypothetical protein MC885_002443, partial [Smutsia gigantea]
PPEEAASLSALEESGEKPTRGRRGSAGGSPALQPGPTSLWWLSDCSGQRTGLSALGSSSSRLMGGVDGWASGSGDGTCVASSDWGHCEGLGAEPLDVYGLRCRAKEPSCREFRGLKEQRGDPLGWGGPGVSSTLSSCCSTTALAGKQVLGVLPRPGELVCGLTALMGILPLCLSFSLCSRSWMLLGAPAAPSSGRQLWAPPLAGPGPPASPRSPASFWCTGSMSLCQLRSSFLARLASSSFFVFLRTSLMSFPSRVSCNRRDDNTLTGQEVPREKRAEPETAGRAPVFRMAPVDS